MPVDLERPLRYPDASSAPLMTKRARWLVALGFLLPGSAQVLAGNRRLGRFGLGATFLLIALVLVGALGLLLAQELALTIMTNSIFLLVLQILIAAYGVLWLVLGFDTLRLTRLVAVLPNWRVPVAMLAVLLTVLPAGAAAWAAVTVGAARGAIGDIFGGGAPAVEPVDGRYNILLLGADAGEDREGLRPDSISLVSVDATTGQSVIIGLPRDLTEMPFPESSPMHAVHPNGFCAGPNAFGEYGGCLTTGQINGIYAEVELVNDPDWGYLYTDMYADAESRGSSPGIEAMKDAVSGATGLTVQFYVLVDMSGFASLIDALGGVTIEVTQPIPLGGYEDPETGVWVDGDSSLPVGVHHMNGETALMFARVRHGLQNGDYDRMQHQRQLQAAILAQMNPANVLLRFQEVAATGSSVVQTDIPESMLGRFVDLATRAKDHAPVAVELVPPAVDPMYPDYGLIHQLVADGVAAASPPQDEAE